MRRDVLAGAFIAGYAETPIAFRSGKSAYTLAGEVLEQMLDRYSLGPKDIDGLSVTAPLSEGSNPFFSVYMADALGLAPRWLDSAALGGASALGGTARAIAAVAQGSCEVALVLSADAPSTAWRSSYGAWRTEFQEPTGILSPPAAFGLLMNRYAHQYGLAPEALGKIAITQRSHALLNPHRCGKLEQQISMEDYLSSRVISDPLRILDSVMFCDGANAVLVVSPEAANRLGLSKRVRATAYAEVTNPFGADPLADITITGFDVIGPKLLSDAGLMPRDIQMFQPYDDFTIAVLMQLESFGFCAKGQGAAFVNDTDLSWRGGLPLNTGGGQLSAGQPGLASGGLNLVEALRQLFGEADGRQIACAKNALVTGIGVIPYAGNWSVSNAMVLESCEALR
jgi:acetyl-CoA acetyltransferase